VTENLPGRITDPKALRALSHPTRWKLIELLGLEPTATATRCAEFTGESVASCSYHLNMLAKYGFVEQADGGQGREKPWRRTSRELRVSDEGLEPEGVLAAETVGEVFLDHEHGRMKEYVRRASREPEKWRRVTGTWSGTPYLTSEELKDVGAEFEAILDRFRGRTGDPSQRPEGSRAVRLFLATYLPQTLPNEE
jgi:hypothetical protein